MLIQREYKEGVHYNREIERAVLGICLLEKPHIPYVIRQLKPEFFYNSGHQVVFNTIKEMHVNRLDIDLLTTVQYLWSKGVQQITSDNTAAFLTRLTRDVVSGTHVQYHCAILQDLYLHKVAYAKGEVINKKSAKWKFPPHARWYLSMITKGALRLTAPKYGRELVTGQQGTTLEVPNKDWVYLMHLVDPQSGWTCIPGRTPYKLTREECVARLPVDKKLYVENQSELVWR